MHSDTERRHRKTAAKTGAVIVFVFAVVWFFRISILNSAGGLITAKNSDDIINGDPAILLMGDRTGERAGTSLKFLDRFPDSRIIIGKEEPTPLVESGHYPHAHDVHRKILTDFGIDPDRILTPACVNTSTLDEARCAKAWLSAMAEVPAAVVVITSWYHSGRAAWIFDKVFADSGIKVKSYSYTRLGAPHQGWWTKENSFLNVFNEYLKWTYWFFNQHHMKQP